VTAPPGWARLVRADNPGPMTLEGTNTWVLAMQPDTAARGAAGGAVPRSAAQREVGSCVVDPGPDDESHLAAVAATGPVALILLTHGHPDHSAGAPGFAARVGAPVRALDPALCHGAPPLVADEVIEVAGLSVRVLATPGHTADSVSLLVAPTPRIAAAPGEDPEPAGAVLTGDTVLGRGSSVIAHPDGHLGSYLSSLRRLRELGRRLVLPGHGPVLPDLAAAADAYLAHRAERLAQVRAAVAAGALTARDVVRQVYGDLDPALYEAAARSAQAQLDYLREQVSAPGVPTDPDRG